MSETTSNTNPANEFEERKRKLQELRDLNIQPYAERFDRTHTTQEALEEGQKIHHELGKIS